MKLPSFCKYICVATLMALVYINMQMQIVSLAYQGKDQEIEIQHLIEDNHNILYDIMAMKSANYIGHSLLAEGSELDFADDTAFVEIVAPVVEERVMEARVEPSPRRAASLFSRVLSLVSSEAEAKVR